MIGLNPSAKHILIVLCNYIGIFQEERGDGLRTQVHEMLTTQLGASAVPPAGNEQQFNASMLRQPRGTAAAEIHTGVPEYTYRQPQPHPFPPPHEQRVYDPVRAASGVPELTRKFYAMPSPSKVPTEEKQVWRFGTSLKGSMQR